LASPSLARAKCGRAGVVSALLDRITVYAVDMNAESSSRSLGKTLVAGLILVVAGWLVLHFVIHLVVFVATIAVVVLAVVALVWALRVLF
jgi:hypothetical protein